MAHATMQDFDIRTRTQAFYLAIPHERPAVETPTHVLPLTMEQSLKFPLTSNIVRLYLYPHSGKIRQQTAILDLSRVCKRIPSITE